MDFFGFKVGDTPLLDIPQLSGRYGARVYVKDESKNTASGTFKDRRNAYLLTRDENVADPIWYVQISSGNSALSMGRLAGAYQRETGRKRGVVNIIDASLPESLKRMISVYGKLHEMDLSRGKIPNHVLDNIGRQVVGDPDAVYKPVEHIGDDSDGYGTLAGELYPEHADVWVLPVGEGELMTKMALSVHEKPDTPAIIGVTVNGNPFAHYGRVERKKFNGHVRKSVADKLVTPYSDFREILDKLCRSDGHEIYTVSERAVKREFSYLTKELMLDVEPSSAAPFAWMYPRSWRDFNNQKMIVINTGKGIYELPKAPAAVRKAALAAAAAGLIGLGALGYHQYDKVMDRRALEDKWDRESISFIQERISSQTSLADIYAYALSKAEPRKIDGKYVPMPDMRIVNDLEMWYIENDFIVREIYKSNERFRNTINDFQNWKKHRKEQEEERMKAYQKWIEEGLKATKK